MASICYPGCSSSFLDELLQGQALTRQLHTQLEGQLSLDLCKSTVQGILASWEKLMSMTQTNSAIKLESPTSAIDSPRVRTPKKPLPSQEQQRPSTKKRKVLPTNQVLVKASTGVETDDGYNWRKYGQKRILGSQNPRAYFRCTHRFTQSCEALKMVQRSDENPSVLEVTYRGGHTCSTRRNGKGHFLKELKVETENLEFFHQVPTSTSGNQSAGFSPLTPESVGFPVSPWFEEEYQEILSAASSVANSPIIEDILSTFAFEDSPIDFDTLFP